MVTQRKFWENGKLNEAAFRDYFKGLEDGLLEKIQDLINRKYTLEDFEKGKIISGVYVFWEGNEAVYVGRTNDIEKRYKQHFAAKIKQSPLARKLAKEALAKDHQKNCYLLPSYGKKDRAEKINKEVEEKLKEGDIKKRIKGMGFSFVCEENSFLQGLLESLCFLALGTADIKQKTIKVKKGEKGKDNIDENRYCYKYYNSFDTS